VVVCLHGRKKNHPSVQKEENPIDKLQNKEEELLIEEIQ
jgi:hypothetical protein